MHKHPPGPWTVEAEEDQHTIRMALAIDFPGSHLAHHIIEYCHGLYPEDGEQWEEADAIARLIAAAPDLLEALRETVDELIATFHQLDEHRLQEYGPVHTMTVAKAHAAIAKANGGTDA